MRRLLLTLLCSVALLAPVALASSPVAAVNVFGACSNGAANTDVCKDKVSEGTSNPVIKALKITITIMAFVIGFTATLMIIIGGINMSMAGGDPQKVAHARSTLIYAAVGVAIAVASESIVAFVLNKL